MSKARAIMVMGTTSGAGKSWLATALCRHYARQGLRVAPFKAQNMSNNARVVASPTGQGEIGAAQYFQALAARAQPEVRMNPLLLKPEGDTRSQVVLLGQVDEALTRCEWRARSERVWPVLRDALDGLRTDYDLVVIEGAGSPAEINLMDSDVVNLRVARHADARSLLVTDIDRGGAFAHLYGTWALLPASDRRQLRGFALNRFRGDATLLAPAPERLQALTGVPTLAVLPMWRGHGLPEEDGLHDGGAEGAVCSAYGWEGAPGTKGRGADADRPSLRIAIVAYPRISNLDEFQALRNMPGVRLRWARSPADLDGVDWIILPGSKHTSGDLLWLRQRGLDHAVAAHAARGGAVLGICGGLQMLGEALVDPEGIDGNAAGLGLLPLVTQFAPDKTVRLTRAQWGRVQGPWAALSGVKVQGYEIHHGRTVPHPALIARGDVAREVLPGLGWQNAAGNVLGLYLHGMFEDGAIAQALFGADGATVPTLDRVFDGLADFVARHFQAHALDSLLD